MLIIYLFLAATALGVFQVIKDWEAYKTPWRRWSVLVLIIMTGLGGAANSYYSDSKIAALQASVDEANNSQRDNTQLFINAFNEFSQKVSELQSKVDNANLKEEAAQLNKDLAAYKKALISPKATLIFSFEKKIESPPIRQITLPVLDNKVRVAFTFENKTDETALDGFINVIICQGCKFSSETPGFQRLDGQPDTERHFKFQRIHPRTILAIMSVDILVPSSINDMRFMANYRCNNCIIPEPKDVTGVVHLKRSVVTPVISK